MWSNAWGTEGIMEGSVEAQKDPEGNLEGRKGCSTAWSDAEVIEPFSRRPSK